MRKLRCRRCTAELGVINCTVSSKSELARTESCCRPSSSTVVLGPAASASCGSSVEVQTLRPHPGSTTVDSEFKWSFQATPVHTRAWEVLGPATWAGPAEQGRKHEELVKRGWQPRPGLALAPGLALGPWPLSFILWTSVFLPWGEARCLPALTFSGSESRVLRWEDGLGFGWCRRNGDWGERVSVSTLRNEYTMNGKLWTLLK